MVDTMEKDEKVKQIVKTLKRQYETDKYGKLHKALLKERIETDLYVGMGMEIHYPDAYDPLFTLYVFDKENLVILDRRESELKNDPILQKTLKIAESLKYKVKEINELSEDEQELYFC